ncbi:MAG: PilT/PilU family type 4a pilus ATPase, partial [Candidatus Eisenbacteria bacterium]|nr:PilT/PilU family type 4a pilus ATPase [Candidatus Eisenbacteria bacterium]
GVARFRANFYLQRGTIAGALRSIPLGVPRLEELNLPVAVADLVGKPRGLILVTGTVGSGKSTTLAAMIHHINRTTGRNIITVEDPIEFLHWNIQSIISQREVGQDTVSYLAALRCILRQDPDVILIGEIRDRETMSVALMAADTGHLVLSTLHTTDAAQTINRIISFYPPHQHEEVRYLLAGSLQAVVSMRLIPRADAPGRVPAVELMVNTETIRECLRDRDQTPRIRDVIAEGVNQYGMQTFDQSLMDLYRRGLIGLDEALKHATTPTEFELRLKGIEATSDQTWEAIDQRRGEGPAAGAPAPAPARGDAAPRPRSAGKEDRREGQTAATLFPELGPRTRRAAADRGHRSA